MSPGGSRMGSWEGENTPPPPPSPIFPTPHVRIGVSVKQQFTEEEIYKDRDSQIAAIEKTFEDAQKAVRGEGRFWGTPPGYFGG